MNGDPIVYLISYLKHHVELSKRFEWIPRRKALGLIIDTYFISDFKYECIPNDSNLIETLRPRYESNKDRSSFDFCISIRPI